MLGTPVNENRSYNILFLCTGNSARSILAEALVNRYGSSRYKAYSAGSQPTGAIHPMTIRLLDEMGVNSGGFRSKSWDEFTQANAPEMDCVITVCDRAAAEPCPVWPGKPAVAHWSIPDPASVVGSASTQLKAFREIFNEINIRVNLLLSLEPDKLTMTELSLALQNLDAGHRQ